jgi:hypothetical protein
MLLLILYTQLCTDCIDFPRFHQVIQLQNLGHGLCNLVFNYLRQAWSDDFKLISDVALATMRSQVSFLGVVKSFMHLWVSKHRYEAGEYTCGTSLCQAAFPAKFPVQSG